MVETIEKWVQSRFAQRDLKVVAGNEESTESVRRSSTFRESSKSELTKDTFTKNQLLDALNRAREERGIEASSAQTIEPTRNSVEVSHSLGFLDAANKSRVLNEFKNGVPSAETLYMFQKLLRSDSPVARAVANQLVTETNERLREMDESGCQITMSHEKSTIGLQRRAGRSTWQRSWDLSSEPDQKILEYAQQKTVDKLVEDLTDGHPSYSTIQLLGELMKEKLGPRQLNGISFGEHVATQLITKANAALKAGESEHYLALSSEGSKFEVFHVNNNDYNKVTFESYDLKPFARR